MSSETDHAGSAAMQGPYSYSLNLNQTNQEDIIKRLDKWNRIHTPNWSDNNAVRFKAEQLSLYVHDSDGRLIGGLLGTTHSVRGWFDINVLFVEEANRGCRLGSALMRHAEEEAYSKGCRYARVATGSHQAPGFYEKIGYTLYGSLENFPHGVTFCWYKKRLQVPESGSE